MRQGHGRDRLRRPVVAALAAALAAGVVATASGAAAVPVVRIPFPRYDGTLTPYTFELGYRLVTLVYDTLTWRDEEGIARPWLARSISVEDGGRTIVVEIRDGVTWHDGVPLTASDVEFTFHHVADRYHPRFTPQVARVTDVRALDETTVRFSLDGPSLGFLDQPLADVPILPRHLWEGLPLDRLAPAGPPVGSGPYRLAASGRRRGYRFEAVEDHFMGPPEVEVIEVPFMDDLEETLAALQTGDVDAIPVTLPPGSADAAASGSVRVATGPYYLGTVLMLNVRAPPFDDPAVRRATANALDLEVIANAAGGIAARNGYLHPDSAWATDDVLHEPDAAAARAVLGDPAVEPARVLAPNNDPARLEAGRRVVLALEEAGLDTTLVAVAPEELSRAIGEDAADAHFQAAIWSSPALVSYDPDFLAAVFGSDPMSAPLNYSGYDDRGFDAIARRVSAAPTIAAREVLVARALRLLARDAPVIPLYFAEGAFAYRARTYAGWVYVDGTGIIDKLSFLRREPRATPRATGAPDPVPEPSESPIGPLGWAALALVAVAGGIAVAGIRRGG